MADITSAAYADLRAYVEANWQYIALYDNAGTPAQVVRLPVADARVTWTHAPGAQTLELTVVLKGSDTDVGGSAGASLPKTLASSRLHKTAGDSTSFSTEPFTAFTFQTVDDELTVRHRIQVPKLT